MTTATQPETSNIMIRPKGMTLYVLRNARWESEGTDCTAGGVTSRFEMLLLIGSVTTGRADNGQQIVKPLPLHMRVFDLFDRKVPNVRMISPDITPVALHPGNMTGAPFLAPVEWSERGQCWTAPRGMAGGNYAALGDSRVRELVENMTGFPFYGALSVHDRFER